MLLADNSVRELIHLRPKLRKDISITVKKEGAERSFVIEDPVRGKYYRIGEPEYRFVGLLDGTVTIGDALTQVARDLGENALSEKDAGVIINWVYESGLMQSESDVEADRILDARQKRSDQKLLRWLNPLFIKVPLCNPNKFLTWCRPLARIIFSGGGSLIWLLVVLSGLVQVLINSGKFSSDASSVLSSSNWLSLIGVWVGLKVIHELFHGLACKRYDGDVNEAGVIMILLAPIGYVDATSSWKFTSRWKRMYTATAGIYIEFFIAAIAAWIWADAEPGLVRDICYNIILLASINTLLFNANPLMKFDGYYIFSDLVNIPNLYLEGASYVKYLGRRYLLGVPTQFPSRSAKDDNVIKVYGVLSFIWRTIVIATLLIAASALFQGVGLIMAFLALCIIVVIPCAKFLKYLFVGNDQEKPNTLRFLSIVSILSIGVFFGLFRYEWNQSILVHGLVEFESIKEYRTLNPSLVKEIHVKDGDVVIAGAKLVSLSNPELEVAIAQQKIDLQKIKLERKKMLTQKKLADYQASEEQQQAAEKKLFESKLLLTDLEIIADVSGTVIMIPVDNLIDRHVNNSDVILSIARSDKQELRLALPQREINRIRLKTKDKIPFYLPGRDMITATVTTITPSAADALINQPLTAVGGGAIPVIPDSEGDYKLVEPHFWIFADINTVLDEKLGSGERGLGRISGGEVSLGFLWVRAVRDWVKGITNQIKRS